MNQQSNRWITKNINMVGLLGIALGTVLFSSQALAQGSVPISLVSGSAQGNGLFKLIVKDTPGTKLELYVNDKNPSKATVNKSDLATFNKVKLSGSGKLSFTDVVKGKQKPINYTRKYTVKNNKVSFSSYTTVSAAPATKVASRQVTGTATTLGAGTFTGGKDVAVGLYNVTAGAGQSGNFVVTGTDSYDEILDATSQNGEPEIRVRISNGDQIQISGLNQVIFTPVTTPFITTHSTVNLYAGTWTVGQDIGAGRYVATPGAGQSGNFIVTGTDSYDEILDSSGANGDTSLTVNLSKGDIIDISGMSQVTLTASN